MVPPWLAARHLLRPPLPWRIGGEVGPDGFLADRYCKRSLLEAGHKISASVPFHHLSGKSRELSGLLVMGAQRINRSAFFRKPVRTSAQLARINHGRKFGEF
jgi:hypothetical protein